MKQALWAVLLTLPAWAMAETAPPLPEQPQAEPELRLNTAQPEVAAVQQKPAAAGQVAQRVLEVDEAMLLQNPALLSRAMQSAVMEQNTAGIKVLLPIYKKWPQHDVQLAELGRALVAQAEGRAKEAVGIYRAMIAEYPDAAAIRFRLAQALFDDRQNEAAADQFERLGSENLPEPVREMVEKYREALRQRDTVQVYAGVSVSRDSNINQAPESRQLGGYLNEAQCAYMRQENPDDDCWRGWTFDAPIDAAGINYQAGIEKKWSLPGGWYTKAGADVYGKYYPSYGRYNDTTARVSAGVGYADQRNDAGLTPFHERRIYGNDAYSYSNGVRLHWNHWWLPRLQSLQALELGRLKNMQRLRSDNDNRLLSGSLVFYRNARQSWLLGADVYQERNDEDKGDNFNRFGVRAAWGQEWPKGISTRLSAGYAQRRYQTPSFLSEGVKRRDKEWNASLSLWHRALHFGGVTPRFTISRLRTQSNDAFYSHGKTRSFIELNKAF
ncbi:MAG: surface lipoprotein assembly modifier [Neisseria sp.]|nr:surface lipoprotein assembly modifier [Neisseria sp.]